MTSLDILSSFKTGICIKGVSQCMCYSHRALRDLGWGLHLCNLSDRDQAILQRRGLLLLASDGANPDSKTLGLYYQNLGYPLL